MPFQTPALETSHLLIFYAQQVIELAKNESKHFDKKNTWIMKNQSNLLFC